MYIKQKGNTTTIISVVVAIILIFGALLYARRYDSPAQQTAPLVEEDETVTERRVLIIEQPEDYGGTKGQRVVLENGEVRIDAAVFNDNTARFYNVDLLNGKTVYFFIVKDKNGVLRAAANECQICYAVKKGFRQEGDEMVCNNCGNRYPIERIATEKGGCNPAPINPNLEIIEGNIIIEEEKLEEVSVFF